MAAWYDLIDRGDEATATPLAVSGAAGAVGTTGAKYALEDHRHAFTPSTDLSMAGFKLTTLGTPTADGDAAPKSYVDASMHGWDWKGSVRVATTANGALATAYENGDTVDGVVLATGDRILLKDQTTGAENGIYTVNASGAPTRAIDMNTSAEASPGSVIVVEEGTANLDTMWMLTTNAPITLDTTALVFTSLPLTPIVGGAGMTKTGQTLDVIAADGTITVNADSIQVGVLASGNFANATISNARLITDPLARANHTGTQTASTISDFDTAVRTSRVDQMAAPQGTVDYSHASAFLKLPKVFAYANAAALPSALANGMLAFQTDTVRLKISR